MEMAWNFILAQVYEPCIETLYLFLSVLQDPTNLQGKVQKHQNFEAEVSANQGRIEAVTQTGEELIEFDHYARDLIRYG